MSTPCYCGECNFMEAECSDGFGYCEICGHSNHCGDRCVLDHTKISREGLLKGLHYLQKWRRGAKIKQPQPYVIGKLLDAAMNQLRQKCYE